MRKKTDRKIPYFNTFHGACVYLVILVTKNNNENRATLKVIDRVFFKFSLKKVRKFYTFILVNGFKSLIIFAKCSILDV